MLTRAIYTRSVNYSIRVRVYPGGRMAFRIAYNTAKELNLFHGQRVDLLFDQDSGKFMLRVLGKDSTRGAKLAAIPWSNQKKKNKTRNPPSGVSACAFSCYLDIAAKVSPIVDSADPDGKAIVMVAHEISYAEKEATFTLRKHAKDLNV